MPHPTALASTEVGDLLCQDGAGRRVHRVGFEPEPWAWTPWQYAEHGRFSGRWDDPDGVWRSIYVGAVQLAPGDGLTLWAVFERPGDDDVSALLRESQSDPIDEDDPELREAMRIHRLQ